MAFYDYFLALILDPVMAGRNLAIVQSVTLWLLWAVLIAVLVVQTNKKIWYLLILAVTVVVGVIGFAAPRGLETILTLTGGGLLIAGAMLFIGTRRLPVAVTPIITSFAAMIIGASMIILPVLTLQYGFETNKKHYLDRLTQIAALDQERFFLLCKQWHFSCGQQAAPAAGLPESSMSSDGRMVVYHSMPDHQMRVVIDRQSGRLLRDSFQMATEIQRLAVALVWVLLAIVAMAGHRWRMRRGCKV
jgi:hypothetical protein